MNYYITVYYTITIIQYDIEYLQRYRTKLSIPLAITNTIPTTTNTL